MIASEARIRKHWKKGDHLTWEWANFVSNFIGNFRVVGGTFRWNGIDAVLTLAALTPQMAFGLKSATGQDATFNGGPVYRGSRAPVEVSETEVEFTGGTKASPHFAYAEYTLSSHTATIATTALASLPTPDSDTFRVPLAAMYWDGTSLLKPALWIYHTGPIIVPAL